MTKSIPGGSRAANRLRKILRSRAEIHLDHLLAFHARTIDISTVGMSLMSPRELDDGACLTIVFQIPMHGKLETINAAATVLYQTPDSTKGYRVGIRFLEEDTTRNDLINQLL